MDRLYVLLEKGLFKSFAHFLFPHEDMLIDFRERGGEGERERERERETSMRETSIMHLLHAPYWDQTHNLGMRPDWELNMGAFG